MAFILLFILFGLFCFSLLAGFITWHVVTRYLENRRKLQLESLRGDYKRLNVVIQHLLAKVDEVDQESKYVEKQLPADWSKAFATACNQVIVLSDGMRVIEESISLKDVGQSRQHLLRSVRIAVRVSGSLRELRTTARSKVIDFGVVGEPTRVKDDAN